MKQRQMAAMQEQMRLDAEQLARIDSKSSMKLSESTTKMGEVLDGDLKLPSNKKAIRAAVSGTVWETKVEIGQEVQGGETLFVLEAMKMEYAVTAPASGRIAEISVSTGELVQQGAPLCLVCD